MINKAGREGLRQELVDFRGNLVGYDPNLKQVKPEALDENGDIIFPTPQDSFKVYRSEPRSISPGSESSFNTTISASATLLSLSYYISSVVDESKIIAPPSIFLSERSDLVRLGITNISETAMTVVVIILYTDNTEE